MMRTNKNDIDSDDDIEGNDKFKERERKDSSSHFPTVMHNIYGQNLSFSKLLIEYPKKVKLLVLLLQNLIWKHFHFLQTILQKEITLMRTDKFQ